MPIGGKPPSNGPPRKATFFPVEQDHQPQRGEAKIKKPFVVVPPAAYEGSGQRSVVRADPSTGKVYIDIYSEYMNPAFLRNDGSTRVHLSVWCPKLQHCVAMAACHLYCQYPCELHVRTITQQGWYGSGSPPYEEKKVVEKKVKTNKSAGKGGEGTDND